MKKINKRLWWMGLLLAASGCFDDYEGTIDTEQFWVYFESAQTRFDEGQNSGLTVTLLLSAPVPDQDVVVPFTVASDDNLVEGNDYFQSFATFTIPAGENIVTIPVLDSIPDDQVPIGDRVLTITLQDVAGLVAGFPGPDKIKSQLRVVIAEDDFTFFGQTSFEQVPAPASTTLFNRPGTNEINNNPGEPPVDFVATGEEMGFDSSYALDDLDDNETSAENLGVVSNAAIGSAEDFQTQFVRGNQGFVAADLDGRIEIVFDPVDLGGEVSTLVVEATFYMNAGTNFETEDALEVFYEVDGVRGDPIMSFRGDDDTGVVRGLDGEAVQGRWVTSNVAVPEDKRVNGRLVATMRTGADSELVMLDYIAVKGIR